MIRLIKKALAGREDLLVGIGTEIQTRPSGDLPITKINPTELQGALVVDTLTDLQALDVNTLGDTKVAIVAESCYVYVWDGAQWESQLKLLVDSKAPIESPSLTGEPTSPTPPTTDSSTRIATTKFVHNVANELLVECLGSSELISINAPILSVQGEPSDVPESPQLTTSNFSASRPDVVHVSTDWVITKDGTDIWDSLNNTTNLLSIYVPSGVLIADEEYIFSVRHNGSSGSHSDYTSVTASTTTYYEDNVPLLAVASNREPFLIIYDQDISTFTKLPDLEVMPDKLSHAVAFSYDDTYFICGNGDISSRFLFYKRQNNVFINLVGVGTQPESGIFDIEFSSDATYIAMGLYGSSHSNGLALYKRSGDLLNRLPDPADLPYYCYSVSFSYDDTYLAAVSSESPYIIIYKRSGDTFTKLTDPGTLPAYRGMATSFNSDASLLAVGHYNSPYVTIYERSGDTFTKLPDLSDWPSNASVAINAIAFSHNDTYLACGSYSGKLVIYKVSGTTFTKLTDPVDMPAGIVNDIKFSADDSYLAVATDVSPHITIYERSGDVFTKVADPDYLPSGACNNIAFSNTGF